MPPALSIFQTIWESAMFDEYRCPYCKNKLNGLSCEKHGTFQTIDDIPIFIKETEHIEFDYFQKHWKDLVREPYPTSKFQTAEVFLEHIDSTTQHGKILDAGCGDGLQMRLLSDKLDNDTNTIYGIDISIPALQKTKYNNPQAVALCADIMHLPFPDNYFDIVFTYGVIAITSDPKRAFEELCRVAKKGAKIGTWFYPKPNMFLYFLLKSVRKLATCCNKRLLGLVADMIVPFLYILPTASKINLSNASWKECKEIVMVNIAPENLWLPTEEEILQLYEDNGIDVEYVSSENKILVWGTKR